MNFEDKSKALEKYGRELTKMWEDNKMDPVIGRDEEIRNLIRILSRKTKNNPVLIGDPGVGKTAIVEGLAGRIVRGDVPDDLKNKKIWELDLSALVAGAKYQGEFEERFKAVLKEIADSKHIRLIGDELSIDQLKKLSRNQLENLLTNIVINSNFGKLDPYRKDNIKKMRNKEELEKKSRERVIMKKTMKEEKKKNESLNKKNINNNSNEGKKDDDDFESESSYDEDDALN